MAQGEIADGDAENVNDDEVPEVEAQEEFEKFSCMPCEEPGGAEEDAEEEAEAQRPATDPGQPTQREREERARARDLAQIADHRRRIAHSHRPLFTGTSWSYRSSGKLARSFAAHGQGGCAPLQT